MLGVKIMRGNQLERDMNKRKADTLYSEVATANRKKLRVDSGKPPVQVEEPDPPLMPIQREKYKAWGKREYEGPGSYDGGSSKKRSSKKRRSRKTKRLRKTRRSSKIRRKTRKTRK